MHIDDSKRIVFKKFVFDVDKRVYEPEEDTFLLAENLQTTEEDVVLDMGTGCGILAILSAERAKQVVAIDINPYAVKCAKKNAKMNKVSDKVEFIIGDLFQPLRKERKFNLIIFNAPYLPAENRERKDWIDYAWAGGADGREIIDHFVDTVSTYITKKGRILLVQSTLSNVDKTIKRFREKGFEADVIAESKAMFETIVLIEATLTSAV